MKNLLAVYEITSETNLPIDAEDYSKFKFGDKEIADKYGTEMFHKFRDSFLVKHLNSFTELIIYSSPYSYIPTASYYLTHLFYSLLESYIRVNNVGNVSLRLGKINRINTYTADYGAMNAQERFDLIKNDTYELSESINNKSTLIFIDDISITGTHQLVIEKLLREKNIFNKCYFLYYSKLVNDDINPNFENKLNYAYINSVDRFMELLVSKSFVITTRAIKYILKLGFDDLKIFMDRINRDNKIRLLQEINHSAILNSYNHIEEYKINFEIINKYLSSKNSLTSPKNYFYE